MSQIISKMEVYSIMALYMDFNVDEKFVLVDPSTYFGYYYDKRWFNDPEVVRVAEKIDGVRHVDADIFDHPLYGRCFGKELSGGVHTVLLAYLGELDDEDVLPLSWLGENCFSVLGSLNIRKDITFDGDYMPDLWDWNCKFISKKTGNIISNYKSYAKERAIYVLYNRNEES